MSLIVTQRPQKDIYENIPPGTYEEPYYTSRWVAAHLPIQYKISNTKWPLNTDDDTDNIVAVYSTNGYATIQLPGTYETYESKGYIKITDSNVEAYNGIWQIVTSLSPTLFVINTSYISTAIGSVQKYYKNYHVTVKLYAGIPSYHAWVSQDPMSLIATVNVTPNSDNISIVDVGGLVRQKLNTNNDIDQVSFPNDLNLWTSFYIEYAESYDYVLDGEIETFISAYTPDTLDDCESSVSLTNEEFTSNLNGWSQNATSNLNWAWNSGAARVTYASPTVQSQYLYQDASFLQGISYSLDLSVTPSNNSKEVFFALILSNEIDPDNGGDLFYANFFSDSEVVSINFTPSIDFNKINFVVFFNTNEGNGATFDVNYIRLSKTSDCIAYIFASNSALPFKSTYGGNMGQYVQTTKALAPFLNFSNTYFEGKYFDLTAILPQATLDIADNSGILYNRIKEYDENDNLISVQTSEIGTNGDGIYRIQIEDNLSLNTKKISSQIVYSPQATIADTSFTFHSFLPSDISGLIRWYDSRFSLNSGIQATNNTSIDTWTDMALGQDAVSVPGKNLPVYIANVLNGKPALSFGESGTTQLLEFPSTGSLANYTIFVVRNYLPTLRNVEYFLAGGNATTFAGGLFAAANSSSKGYGHFNLSGDGRFQNATPPTDWGIYMHQKSKLTFNGVEPSYSNTGDGIVEGISLSRIGTRMESIIEASAYFSGKIANILIYNRELTSDEISQVNTYLEDLYNL